MSSKLVSSVTVDDSGIVSGTTIDAVKHTTPLGESESELREGWSKVSSNDTHVKHLEDAIVGQSGITKVTVLNEGGNEQLEITDDATGVPSGYTKVANGSGGVSWAALGGGGAAPIDVTGTAGEALAERDYVFLDASDSKWYKVDTDATPVKCGELRGIVNEAGGISSSSTGSIRLLGEVSGYTGLTAWQMVYASTTPGSITQTRPDPVSGTQIAIIEIGKAISATNIVLQPSKPVLYMLRNDALANDGTLTIQHHKDTRGHGRDAKTYISTDAAGPVITEYTSSNQDTSFALNVPAGSGATTNFATTNNNTVAIGAVSGSEYWRAQTFSPGTSGIMSQITFDLGANSGSPTGTITWEIWTDSSGSPGTLLQSGTHTATASATNTVSVTDGLYLDSATTYWLVLRPTTTQTGTNFWSLVTNTGDQYAGGSAYQSNNSGTSWSTTTNNDILGSVTTSASSNYVKLSQSFTLASASDISAVLLYLKKVGLPTGTMTIRIEADSSGDASGTLADAAATVTYSESSLTTSLADVSITFASSFNLAAGTYHVVVSTDRSNDESYVLWGADSSSPGYSGGEAKTYNGSTWSSASADFIFGIYAPSTTFVEPAVIGRWDGGTRDVAVRYDDGAAGTPETTTTFKNVIGATADITAVLAIP